MPFPDIAPSMCVHSRCLHRFFKYATSVMCFRRSQCVDIIRWWKTENMCSDFEKISSVQKVWAVTIRCDPKAVWHWTDLTASVSSEIFWKRWKWQTLECVSLKKKKKKLNFVKMNEPWESTSYDVISALYKRLLIDHRNECMAVNKSLLQNSDFNYKTTIFL